MIRLFVALKIPEEIKREIIFLRDSVLPDPHKYKWESEEKIHLTLKFIGEVKEELVSDIISDLSFLRNYTKINCNLTKFGFFFKKDEAKILWIGLNVESQLFDLVYRLNTELEKFSIAAENRKFKAHITLKRLKGNEGRDFVERFNSVQIPELKFAADEIALIKSELNPKGSIYTEIENYYLK